MEPTQLQALFPGGVPKEADSSFPVKCPQRATQMAPASVLTKQNLLRASSASRNGLPSSESIQTQFQTPIDHTLQRNVPLPIRDGGSRVVPFQAQGSGARLQGQGTLNLNGHNAFNNYRPSPGQTTRSATLLRGKESSSSRNGPPLVSDFMHFQDTGPTLHLQGGGHGQDNLRNEGERKPSAKLNPSPIEQPKAPDSAPSRPAWRAVLPRPDYQGHLAQATASGSRPTMAPGFPNDHPHPKKWQLGPLRLGLVINHGDELPEPNLVAPNLPLDERMPHPPKVQSTLAKRQPKNTKHHIQESLPKYDYIEEINFDDPTAPVPQLPKPSIVSLFRDKGSHKTSSLDQFAVFYDLLPSDIRFPPEEEFKLLKLYRSFYECYSRYEKLGNQLVTSPGRPTCPWEQCTTYNGVLQQSRTWYKICDLKQRREIVEILARLADIELEGFKFGRNLEYISECDLSTHYIIHDHREGWNIQARMILNRLEQGLSAPGDEGLFGAIDIENAEAEDEEDNQFLPTPDVEDFFSAMDIENIEAEDVEGTQFLSVQELEDLDMMEERSGY